MEKFFRSFKTEWMALTGYRSFVEAKFAVNNYITGYYSRVRPHRYNVGLSPNEAEQKYWINHKLVANITWPLQMSKDTVKKSDIKNQRGNDNEDK